MRSPKTRSAATGVLLATMMVATARERVSAQPVLPVGQEIDRGYVAMFADCDATDMFNGVHFPIRSASGTIQWYGCKTDPSRFRRFDRVGAVGGRPEAVIITSKLGHDEDGSSPACHHTGGPTDQCATSLMLQATPRHPCQVTTASRLCVPVDPDEIPYVVIPTSAPPKTAIDGAKFRALSKVGIGDYGVVMAGGKIVPVIVADGGPAYKIGEGSTALLKALSAAGKPHTIGSGVTFVLFPKTRKPVGSLNADTLATDLKAVAQSCFDALTKASPSPGQCAQ